MAYLENVTEAMYTKRSTLSANRYRCCVRCGGVIRSRGPHRTRLTCICASNGACRDNGYFVDLYVRQSNAVAIDFYKSVLRARCTFVCCGETRCAILAAGGSSPVGARLFAGN